METHPEDIAVACNSHVAPLLDIPTVDTEFYSASGRVAT